jgi:hypothetical protein
MRFSFEWGARSPVAGSKKRDDRAALVRIDGSALVRGEITRVPKIFAVAAASS